jgi:uncharacterized protein (DUF2147 family)
MLAGRGIRWIGALLLGVALAAGPAAAANADDILGEWITQEGKARVLIYRCERDQYCGKVVWLREAVYGADDPDAGQPIRDRWNPDPEKRARGLQGLDVLFGFRFDGRRWDAGRIYNPEEGRTYSCVLELESPARLKVRGYVGVTMLGRTVHWTRAPAPTR